MPFDVLSECRFWRFLFVSALDVSSLLSSEVLISLVIECVIVSAATPLASIGCTANSNSTTSRTTSNLPKGGVAYVCICQMAAAIFNRMFWLGVLPPNLPFPGGSGNPIWHSVSLDPTNVPAEWHLHPLNGLSTVTDRQTDRPRYGEMCDNRQNRLRERFRPKIERPQQIQNIWTSQSIKQSIRHFQSGLSNTNYC